MNEQSSFDLLDQLLVADRPVRRDLEVEIAAELVFDDEPLDELLGVAPPQGPTIASAIAPAKRLLALLLQQAGRLPETASHLTREYVLAVDEIAPDVYRQLAPALRHLALECRQAAAPEREAVLCRLYEAGLAHGDRALLLSAGLTLALLRVAQGRPQEANALWGRLGEAQREICDPNQDDAAAASATAAACWAELCAGSDARFGAVRQFLAHFLDNSQRREAGSEAPALPSLLLTPVRDGLLRLATSASARSLGSHVVAVATYEFAAGPRHPLTASCANMLIRSLQDAHEHVAAIALSRQVIAAREGELGARHPFLSTSCNNLGLSLVQTAQFEEALAALERAIDIRPENPFPRYWLAKAYQRRGEPNDLPLEIAAWKEYLRLGGTSPERKAEAQMRLRALAGA